MKAVITTPTSGLFGVLVYHTAQDDPRQDWTKPSFFIPARDYVHARSIAAAINGE